MQWGRKIEATAARNVTVSLAHEAAIAVRRAARLGGARADREQHFRFACSQRDGGGMVHMVCAGVWLSPFQSWLECVYQERNEIGDQSALRARDEQSAAPTVWPCPAAPSQPWLWELQSRRAEATRPSRLLRTARRHTWRIRTDPPSPSRCLGGEGEGVRREQMEGGLHRDRLALSRRAVEGSLVLRLRG